MQLLDFEVTQETDGRGIAEKLNEGMPEGLHVLDCYRPSAQYGSWLRCEQRSHWNMTVAYRKMRLIDYRSC